MQLCHRGTGEPVLRTYTYDSASVYLGLSVLVNVFTELSVYRYSTYRRIIFPVLQKITWQIMHRVLQHTLHTNTMGLASLS